MPWLFGALVVFGMALVVLGLDQVVEAARARKMAYRVHVNGHE